PCRSRPAAIAQNERDNELQVCVARSRRTNRVGLNAGDEVARGTMGFQIWRTAVRRRQLTETSRRDASYAALLRPAARERRGAAVVRQPIGGPQSRIGIGR